MKRVVTKPNVDAREDDEPILPTNEDAEFEQQKAPNAELSTSDTVLILLTLIFDGVTAV